MFFPRYKLFGAILTVIIFSVPVFMPQVLATPYWVKPGVYVKYAALSYEPYVQYMESQGVKERPMTMILFYNHSGALFNIHATGDVFLTFKIERDNGTHFEVAFRLTAHNVTVDAVRYFDRHYGPMCDWPYYVVNRLR